MPVGKTQVHDHESEVVSEGVCNEEPLARQVLKPNLGLSLRVLEDQSKAAVFHFLVNVKCSNLVFAKNWKSVRLDKVTVKENICVCSLACLPFFVLSISSLIVWRVILVNHGCKPELLVFDSLDFSEFVEVHLAQVENHVILLYFPVQRQSVRYLQESFEVVWQLVWGIFFFPLSDGNLSNTYNNQYVSTLKYLATYLASRWIPHPWYRCDSPRN